MLPEHHRHVLLEHLFMYMIYRNIKNLSFESIYEQWTLQECYKHLGIFMSHEYCRNIVNMSFKDIHK